MKYLISFAFIVCLLSHGYSQEVDTLSWMQQWKENNARKVDAGRLLILPLAGPAYTPEMGFTIAGGVMMSFKTNRIDSLIQRSSSPIMFGLTSTGGVFFSSILTSYWLQDKLRINADIWYKDMPDHYWGVGYDEAFNTVKSDSTTAYNRQWFAFNPNVLWQFKKNMFLGLNIDFNSTIASNLSEKVAKDPYINTYGLDNFNGGLGGVFRYDSRDIPVNAWKGLYANFSATFYGSYLGGDNDYELYLLDIRKYLRVGKEGRTLAMQAKTRIGMGDVPYGEMSQLGTPFDLRGYTWGRYRHNSMAYGIAEYRHTFYKANGEIGKHGMVGWLGTGSVGMDPSEFNNWLPNGGIGYRLEVQPRMNLRIDIGIGRETAGFYFNFNEAF